MIILKNNTSQKVFIYVTLILFVVLGFLNLGAYNLYQSATIDLYLNYESYDLETYEFFSNLYTFALFFWIISFCLVLIALMIWTKRIYTDYQKLNKITAYSANMAAFSWIIPILSFFVPYKVMKELFEGVKRQINLRNKHIAVNLDVKTLGYWWASFILYLVITRITGKMDAVASSGLLTAYFFELLVCIAFSFLTYKVVKTYSEGEELIKYALKEEYEKAKEAKHKEMLAAQAIAETEIELAEEEITIIEEIKETASEQESTNDTSATIV